MSYRNPLYLFVIPLLAAACSGRAEGQAVPVEGRALVTRGREVGVLLISGRPALRVRAPLGGLSPGERVKMAAETLFQRVEGGVRPGAVRARKKYATWEIVVGEEHLLEITAQEARLQRSSPASLAQRWAASIRAMLSSPGIVLSSRAALVPNGETRRLTVSGWAQDRSVQVTEGRGVVSAALEGASLVLRALKPGTARVEVTSGSHSAACVVSVKEYAARLDSPIQAEVTGAPAPADLVSAAAELALRRYLPVRPGALLKITRAPETRRALREGRSITLGASVEVSGGGHIPVKGDVKVQVDNREISRVGQARLLYSNKPEDVRDSGRLFLAQIAPGAPGRLFYHHINATNRPLALTVMLVNPGERELTLQIVPGFDQPVANPVHAGHRAGRRFFQRYLRNIGEIYRLPARSSVPVAIDRLAPQEVGSGIAEVQVIGPESGECFIRVTAEEWTGSADQRLAAAKTDAWRVVLPRPATQTELTDRGGSPDVFPTSAKLVSAEYTVGGRWTFIPFGKEAVRDTAGTRELQGNYGVLYMIQLTVHNPGAEVRSVELAFEAGAGPASGLFTIGGEFFDVPRIYPREEKSLTRITLAPQETRQISIQTVPLGGSAYPASLIVRE